MTTKPSGFSRRTRRSWSVTIDFWGYQRPEVGTSGLPRDPATGPPDSVRVDALVSAEADDPMYTEHLTLIVWVRSNGGVIEIAQLSIAPGFAHPEGGLVTTDLRDIPLLDISREILAQLRTGEPPWGYEDAVFAIPQPPKGWATNLAKRPGRTGKGDVHYARAAAAYVGILDQPKPVVMLAKKLKLKPSQVRSTLYEARRRDLLTAPPVDGRPGGELTPKALDLLRQYDQGTEQ